MPTPLTPARLSKIRAVAARRQFSLGVLLENVHDPHNIAAVMRTCDAVGVQHLYVLNTHIAKHKKFGKRSSASANKWLSVHEYDNTQNCITELRTRYEKIVCAYLDTPATSLYEIDFTQSLLLCFGNEHAGISDALRSLSDGTFIIPQVGMVQSLNISVACAVSLYEAFRQREKYAQKVVQGLGEQEERAELIRAWTQRREEN